MLEGIIKGLCNKLQMIRAKESFQDIFTSRSLNNFTMIFKHLPEFVDTLFMNIMSEKVASMVQNDPMDIILQVSAICSGNSSIVPSNAAGHDVIEILCHMDWGRFAKDLTDELVHGVDNDGKIDIVGTMNATLCIYHSVLYTNWSNIIDVTMLMASGQSPMDIM